MDYRIELLNMVYCVTGAEPPYYIYELPEHTDTDKLREIWQGLGLRWNGLIAEEMGNIASGSGRQYFLTNDEYMDRHREEWHVSAPQLEARSRFVYGRDTLSSHLDRLLGRRKDPDMAWFGPVYQDLGYACPHEQTRFYQSDTWRRCAAAVRYIYHYRCSHCGVTGPGLHVHHERPIKTIFSHSCYTNFADSGMRLLCEDCHRRLHKRLARMGHLFIAVSEEEARENRERLRQFWKGCHDRGLCKYCDYFEYDIFTDTSPRQEPDL